MDPSPTTVLALASEFKRLLPGIVDPSLDLVQMWAYKYQEVSRLRRRRRAGRGAAVPQSG